MSVRNILKKIVYKPDRRESEIEDAIRQELDKATAHADPVRKANRHLRFALSDMLSLIDEQRINVNTDTHAMRVKKANEVLTRTDTEWREL